MSFVSNIALISSGLLKKCSLDRQFILVSAGLVFLSMLVDQQNFAVKTDESLPILIVKDAKHALCL